MSRDKQRDLGLLLLRLGIGASFIFIHGWPKLLGGPERWKRVGSALSHVGISFAPTFWGFMAMATEILGGMLLILGLFVRPTAAMLAIVMAVATTMHFGTGDSLLGASHPMEVGLLFVALAFVGGGKLSLDAKLRRKP